MIEILTLLPSTFGMINDYFNSSNLFNQYVFNHYVLAKLVDIVPHRVRADSRSVAMIRLKSGTQTEMGA